MIQTCIIGWFGQIKHQTPKQFKLGFILLFIKWNCCFLVWLLCTDFFPEHYLFPNKHQRKQWTKKYALEKWELFFQGGITHFLSYSPPVHFIIPSASVSLVSEVSEQISSTEFVWLDLKCSVRDQFLCFWLIGVYSLPPNDQEVPQSVCRDCLFLSDTLEPLTFWDLQVWVLFTSSRTLGFLRPLQHEEP